MDTVLPLANDLGLTVDTSCSKRHPKCVQNLVEKYNGDGDVLICWEHHYLTDIATSLGDRRAPRYPDDRYVTGSLGLSQTA